MRSAVFDTTVFIDSTEGAVKDRTAARKLFSLVYSGRLIAYVSPITGLELYQWSGMNRTRETRLAYYLQSAKRIPIDMAIAKEAGEALRPLPLAEKAAALGDAIVAITAKQRNLPVYTRNPDHLRRFYPDILTY